MAFTSYKYIVFNSEQEAISLNNRVTNSLKHLWTDGVTTSYSNILKHPTQQLWAIVIEPGYENYFTEIEISVAISLSDDWETAPKF